MRHFIMHVHFNFQQNIHQRATTKRGSKFSWTVKRILTLPVHKEDHDSKELMLCLGIYKGIYSNLDTLSNQFQELFKYWEQP